MRIAEVLNDYHIIMKQILEFRADAPQGLAQEIGYTVLRQCQAEAQALLQQHFDSGNLNVPDSPGENTKRQLQRYGSCGSSQELR